MADTQRTKHVVDLLLEQHQRVKDLFEEVDRATGSERQEAFDTLRQTLAVHETAEELVTHPAAREAEGGDPVVDARLQEEHDAKELLGDLDKLKVDDPGFAEKFGRLKEAVLAHAEHEEKEEFPLLRQENDDQALTRMADAVEAAERIAPTHPHAGVESQKANAAAGPIAGVIDRTRDAVTAVLNR